jgi:hypothetical protein
MTTKPRPSAIIKNAAIEAITMKPHVLGAAGAIAAQGTALMIGGNAAYHPEWYMMVNAATSIAAFGMNMLRAEVAPTHAARAKFFNAAVGYLANAAASMLPLTFYLNDTHDLAVWPVALGMIGVSAWNSGRQCEEGMGLSLESEANIDDLTYGERKRYESIVLKRFLRNTRFLDPSDPRVQEERDRAEKALKAAGIGTVE